MKKIILKPFREKSIQKKHPWIFSGAIKKIQGNPAPGETVLILDYKKRPMAIGAFSPKSQITVRVWSFDPEESISEEFFYRRIETAIRIRKDLNIDMETNAYRIINSESDGIPGLIVDCYDSFLVCQFLSTGAEFWKQEIISILKNFFPKNSIYERSDALVRKKEGLNLKKGILVGNSPPNFIVIKENSCNFFVDIKSGHKTGFYLDQRDNRSEISYYVIGRKILNCFSYTGGFGVISLKSEAEHVINLDCSNKALQLAEENFKLNSLDLKKVKFVKGNAFKILRQFRDTGLKFDVVILDPPKLIHSQQSFERGLAGYKDINLLGLKLVKSGGILVTFSCSGLLQPYMFQKVIADASVDAHREVKIIKRLGMASDHLTTVNFPEGNYLKGFICKVI